MECKTQLENAVGKGTDRLVSNGNGHLHNLDSAGHELKDAQQRVAELEAFLSAVRGDRQVAVTASEATTALQVALEVEQIAQQGRILAQA